MIKNISIASKKGFTLIEIVIVLSIITIMAATILPREIKRIQIKAGEKTALEISVIHEAARAYYVAVKFWPGNIAALQSGGYLNSSWITNNPWGNAYNSSSTASTYTVSSTVPAEWVNLVARDLPSATISGSTVSSTIAIPGTSYDERVKASSSDSMSDYLDQKVVKSIVVNSNKLELSGDSAAPGASKYYGTNSGGTKGFYNASTLKTYDSGWFAIAEYTGYTKTHNLGTTKVMTQIYLSSSSDGSANCVGDFTSTYDGGHTEYAGYRGVNVAALTTTTVSIRVELLGVNTYKIVHDVNGSSITPAYARIVMLALE